MRKKELLHLHSLLHMRKRHAEVEYEVDAIAFEEYESLGVTPQQMYKRKGEHEEAVMVLLELLVREFDEMSDDGEDERGREPVLAK